MSRSSEITGFRTLDFDNGYSVRVVRDYRGFENLKSDWDCLDGLHGSYEPFFCHGWFALWLSHFHKEKELAIVVLSCKGETEAIAPFMISRTKYKGVAVTKLELIGNAYSPLRYFLFRDKDLEVNEQRMTFIFKYIKRIGKSWDMAELTALPEEGGCYDLLLRSLETAGLTYRSFTCFEDWYLDGIDYSGEQYLASRPGNISKDVPYQMRRLKKIGNLQFTMVTDGNCLDEHMDVYYELYGRSWKRESIGPTFHRDLARLAALHGWLRLGFLSLDGLPMACQLWLSCNGKAYILKIFYDEKFKKYSPGKILTIKMMKHVIDEDKVTQVDYLQGDELYKKDWTPQLRMRYGLHLYSNATVAGQGLSVIDRRIIPLFSKCGLLRRFKEQMGRKIRKSATAMSRQQAEDE